MGHDEIDLLGHLLTFRLVPKIVVVGSCYRRFDCLANLANIFDQHFRLGFVIAPKNLRLVAYAHGDHFVWVEVR